MPIALPWCNTQALMPNARQLPFHAFTLKHSGLVRRIVVDIKLSVAFDINNPPPISPPLLPVKALWDTGATGSVVTPSTAAKLGLVATGVKNSNTAGGVRPAKTYVVNIYLPQGVAFDGMQVSDCVDTGGFEAILGMDIISQGDSVISNHNGETWLTFRVPSSGTTDYVVEAHRALFAGVGRNAPCPCGSGKKFKHCHG